MVIEIRHVYSEWGRITQPFPQGSSRLEEDLALEVEYHSEQRDHNCTALDTSLCVIATTKKWEKLKCFFQNGMSHCTYATSNLKS